jgi:hypothetical protein
MGILPGASFRYTDSVLIVHHCYVKEHAMPTILQFSDNPDYMLLVQYFIRDTTHGAFHVETIHTADPETAIAHYQGTEPVPIVLVEYPRDVAATIQQLHAHPQFADAIILVITGRLQAFQTLTSATVMIGGKVDHLRMLSAALASYNAI